MPDYVTVDSGLVLPAGLQAFADPSRVGGALLAARPNVQVFATPGVWTWIKPAGVSIVQVQWITGGGGGRSGDRGAANSARKGGNGGNGGSRGFESFIADSLTATVSVNVGAGEPGGLAVTTDDTAGIPTAANYTVARTVFGTYVIVLGGTSGSQVQTSVGGIPNTGIGSAALVAMGTPVGGSPGGGIGISNVPSPGRLGSASWWFGNTSAPGGLVDGALPAAALTGGAGIPRNGSAGPGGAASVTKAAQKGADGGLFGGGGGGGGASTNGFLSGAGGKGGDGLMIVYSF